MGQDWARLFTLLGEAAEIVEQTGASVTLATARVSPPRAHILLDARGWAAMRGKLCNVSCTRIDGSCVDLLGTLPVPSGMAEVSVYTSARYILAEDEAAVAARAAAWRSA